MRDDLLRLLADGPYRLSELARGLKLPRWTVRNLLVALKRDGLAESKTTADTVLWSLGGRSDVRTIDAPAPQPPRQFCVGGACYEVVWDGKGSLPGYANLPGMGSALRETQTMIDAGGRRTGLLARD